MGNKDEPTLFVVTRRGYDGREQILMNTDDESCIPGDETVINMIQSGCVVYLRGKAYQPKKRTRRRRSKKEET